MLITFDLEALPTNDVEVIASLEATITAPGQYKKPESIAEWLRDNKDQALKELVAKTSFDGLYGRIACIGWSADDEVHCTGADMSEVDAITAFYAAIDAAYEMHCHGRNISQPMQVCGHNIAGFDLPFLKARSIILGIKPPSGLWKAMNAKPWDECIRDTMLMWNSDNQKRTSMDKLCKALGIPGKDGFDGSMVADEWENGSKEKVISYCCDDVERTKQIYKRLTFQS